MNNSLRGAIYLPGNLICLTANESFHERIVRRELLHWPVNSAKELFKLRFKAICLRKIPLSEGEFVLAGSLVEFDLERDIINLEDKVLFVFNKDF